MPHIHWVARQNKLEIPNDEEDVNTREIQYWMLFFIFFQKHKAEHKAMLRKEHQCRHEGRNTCR
jgi:hypothetical protein